MSSYSPDSNEEVNKTPQEDVIDLSFQQQVRSTLHISPAFINMLSDRHEIGYWIYTPGGVLPRMVIPLDVAELRRCFAATLRFSLTVAYHSLGYMRQTDIETELNALVPATVDVCMTAIYAKLRSIHSTYNLHPTRYTTPPSYSEEIELPLPFALAIQELGAFETRSEPQRRLFVPTYPEGTDYEGREAAEYRLHTYLAYLSTLRDQLKMPLKAINPPTIIGSPWWSLQIRVVNNTTDLICTLPPSLYTDFSIQLRMLFIVADEENVAKDIVIFPNDVVFYGIRAKELGFGINQRVFLALSHCPEEWWSFK